MSAATSERKPAIEISGVIERVTFHNDNSGFCVLRVRTRGQREETTVVGSLPSVTAGEWLVAEGWWVRDKEHGLQFKATAMKTVPPTTAEGIERYLGSGLVKGIGPVLAKRLVGRFGAEVLGVIESRVAELESVDGIGPKRRERIAHSGLFFIARAVLGIENHIVKRFAPKAKMLPCSSPPGCVITLSRLSRGRVRFRFAALSVFPCENESPPR